MFESPGLHTPPNGIESSSVSDAAPQPKFMEGWLDVPDRLQLTPDPAVLQVCFIVGWLHSLSLGVARGDLGEDGLCSQHGALHGCVGPLDLGNIHEASRTANETAAREGQLRKTLKSSLIESPSSVANPGSAFKQWGH